MPTTLPKVNRSFEFDVPYCGALMAGVDEVGRGPLAGDVVAAAVILGEQEITGLCDSKKLSEKKRERFYQQIRAEAKAVSVGRASVAEIDQLNILRASLLAMHRAVEGLAVQPEFVVVDGNRLPDWSYPSQALVKGDSYVDAISAASIIAKVTRDREMCELSTRFPNFSFERHKGYPTALHLNELQQFGVTTMHRRSFAPVRRLAGDGQ